jgi:ribosomal protein L11 methylase PrmA
MQPTARSSPALSSVERHPASFRDPEARVFVAGDRVLRALGAEAAARYDAVRASGLLDALEQEGLVVASRAAPEAPPAGFVRMLEHDALAFVSYPYEWPFSLLKRAALLHLDLHRRALERDVTLTDASAYNLQFRGNDKGCRPVFIDIASFRPYKEGELWAAHRQFCEQFLNPLLLAAQFGIPHHAWYRGSLEGIATAALAALWPARGWLSPRALVHVLLPAAAERAAARREEAALGKIRRARLPKAGYSALLDQLRRWIAGLEPRGFRASQWAGYGQDRNYSAAALDAKRRVVAEFAARYRPATLWDLGCNDGEFTEVALANGAQSAIGFDADPGALELACARAERAQLAFLALYQDASNPSPGQGWLGRERAALTARGRPDALMALAFEHHLALGRNLPLEDVVAFLVGTAPRGLVEFVPKSDATVQRMLALKGDIFPGYSEEAFAAALAARARVVRTDALAGGRKLFWYES